MTNHDKQEPKAPPVTTRDFEPFSECDERLTDVQIKAIKNMTYYRLCVMASQSQLSPLEEAAFLNGAMSVFFACRSQDWLPAPWLLGTDSILDTLARWKAEGRLTEGG